MKYLELKAELMGIRTKQKNAGKDIGLLEISQEINGLDDLSIDAVEKYIEDARNEPMDAKTATVEIDEPTKPQRLDDVDSKILIALVNGVWANDFLNLGDISERIKVRLDLCMISMKKLIGIGYIKNDVDAFNSVLSFAGDGKATAEALARLADDSPKNNDVKFDWDSKNDEPVFYCKCGKKWTDDYDYKDVLKQIKETGKCPNCSPEKVEKDFEKSKAPKQDAPVEKDAPTPTPVKTARKVELIKILEIDTPIVEIKKASGRAICRICGEKVEKGSDDVLFYHSFTDGSYNSWTSVECHAHPNCVARHFVEYHTDERKYFEKVVAEMDAKDAPTPVKTARKRELIPEKVCNFERSNFEKKGTGAERKNGTGRAKCRQCGEKIGKNVQSLHFKYAFSDSPYSPINVQIHSADCVHLTPKTDSPVNDTPTPETTPKTLVYKQLNRIPGGFQLLPINLVEHLIFDKDGCICGVFHKHLKIGYLGTINMDLVDYISSNFGKIKFIPTMPDITISNWNQTLWGKAE